MALVLIVEEDPARVRQAGIDHVLVKACTPDILVAELRRLLERAPVTGAPGLS